MEQIFKIRSALVVPVAGALALVPLRLAGASHGVEAAPAKSSGFWPGALPYPDYCNYYANCSLLCPMLTTVSGDQVLYDAPGYPSPTVAVGEQLNFGWDCSPYRYACPNAPDHPVFWELQGDPGSGAGHRSQSDGDATPGMIAGYSPQRSGTDCVCQGDSCLKPLKSPTTPDRSGVFTEGIMENPAGSTKTDNVVVEPSVGYSIPFQINVVGPSNASIGVLKSNLAYITDDGTGFPSISLGQIKPGFSEPSNGTAGIYFEPKGGEPANYRGQWIWVQVINYSVINLYANVGDAVPARTIPPQPIIGQLDGGYPYLTVNAAGEAYDAPSYKLPHVDPLTKTSDYNQVEFIGKYTMTLMYRPVSKYVDGTGWVPLGPDDSTPVPIGAINWEWDGVATRTGTADLVGNCQEFWCATGGGVLDSCANGACAGSNNGPPVYPHWPTTYPAAGQPLPVPCMRS
jgi:hypothetical protein